jgi:hypothetical protein
MNVNQFKTNYYLEREYKKVSEVEFYCRIIVKDNLNNQEITRIETRINALDVGQNLTDSQFTITPISWEKYLNQSITMLFNMLMLRLNISDIHIIDGQTSISDFFNKNPFHNENKRQTSIN